MEGFFAGSRDKQKACQSCSVLVSEPYILCAECPSEVVVCLPCFAKGAEFGQHQNNHNYEVMRTDFALFEPRWTAGEDLKLLNAIFDCGHGNWHDIALKVGTKTATQCQKHYTDCYVINPVKPLPELPDPELTLHPAPLPMRFCDDPPRPSEGSSIYQDMSGYMAARGDFLAEFSNYAENDVAELDFKSHDTDLDRNLKLAVLDIYHNVVRERHRRKKIIRDHGLINIKRQNLYGSYSTHHIHPKTLEQLRVFMQLTLPTDWQKYMQALDYEFELRSSIKKLQQYRQSGIKILASARIYEKLLKRRQAEMEARLGCTNPLKTVQSDALCEDWLNKQSIPQSLSTSSGSATTTVRKVAPPLQIQGMPSYEKLCEAERKLCSSVRLVPESYLEFKQILMNECAKHGSLRLAQARSLIKIDVNKTRKLYDFLLKQNLINKEPMRDRL